MVKQLLLNFKMKQKNCITLNDYFILGCLVAKHDQIRLPFEGYGK